MALQINLRNGVCMIEGSINTTTAKMFKSHVKALMDKIGNVTINIDNVKEIDVTGLSVLREFYLNHKNSKGAFSITGNGCKEIYHDFKIYGIA